VRWPGKKLHGLRALRSCGRWGSKKSQGHDDGLDRIPAKAKLEDRFLAWTRSIIEILDQSVWSRNHAPKHHHHHNLVIFRPVVPAAGLFGSLLYKNFPFKTSDHIYIFM